MKITDLAQKICICDVITLFIYLHCDIIRHLPVQTRFVYLSSSVQPLSTNFGFSSRSCFCFCFCFYLIYKICTWSNYHRNNGMSLWIKALPTSRLEKSSLSIFISASCITTLSSQTAATFIRSGQSGCPSQRRRWPPSRKTTETEAEENSNAVFRRKGSDCKRL